jgi:hypothetical protein
MPFGKKLLAFEKLSFSQHVSNRRKMPIQDKKMPTQKVGILMNQKDLSQRPPLWEGR